MSAALLRTIRAGSSEFLRRATGLSATCAFITLLAAPAQAAQLTLAWDPSPSTSVTGYYVHVSTAPGTTDRRIDATGLSATITGLNQGKTYYFSVSAHDAAGTESPRSNEVKRVLPTGDFNYNGTADILWRHRTSGLNEIWMMNGATQMSVANLPAVLDSEIVATADFNGDGTTDVLWSGNDGTNTVWLVSNGTWTAASIPSMSDTNWKVAGAGDFNADGKADILLRNNATGANALWLMDGATRTDTLTVPGIKPTSGWSIAVVADFNGDGKSDILWRNSASGSAASGANSVWLMNGAAVIGHRAIPAVGDLNWHIVGAGDFDSDGKSDILWRHATAGANRIWLLNVTTDSAIPALKSHGTPGGLADTAWRVAQTADQNGDGKSDILWRHEARGTSVLWLIDGTTRTSTSAITSRDSNWQVVGN